MSNAGIAEAIRGTGAFDTARATTIARSETARAYTHGTEEGWKQSGVVKGKRWLLAPGACEFCRAAAKSYAGRTVGLGDPFYERGAVLTGTDGGTMNLDYDNVDGPPLHPNCRCDLAAVTE
jgi:hypothetical protein